MLVRFLRMQLKSDVLYGLRYWWALDSVESLGSSNWLLTLFGVGLSHVLAEFVSLGPKLKIHERFPLDLFCVYTELTVCSCVSTMAAPARSPTTDIEAALHNVPPADETTPLLVSQRPDATTEATPAVKSPRLLYLDHIRGLLMVLQSIDR